MEADVHLRRVALLGVGAEALARVVALHNHGDVEVDAADNRADVVGEEARGGELVRGAVGLDGRGEGHRSGAEEGRDAQRDGEPVVNRSAEVERIGRVGRLAGVEVVGQHVDHLVADVDAVDAVAQILHVDVEPRQIPRRQRLDLDAEPFAHRGVVGVGGDECTLEFIARYARQQLHEGVVVLLLQQRGHGVELRGVGGHLREQLRQHFVVDVGRIVEQPLYVGIIAVRILIGQSGRKPDVGLLENPVDACSVVVVDVVHRDADPGQRRLEGRCLVADGDVVGVDVSQVVVVVDAGRRKKDEKHENREFLHNLS